MAMGNAQHAGTIRQLWPNLTTSPELHFHSLDARREAGLLVQMPEGAYHAASFLDGRTFDAQSVGCWVPLDSIRKTVLEAPAPRTPLHFIFHMGHTGSTLLSRLLDESGIVLPLREPLVLREWAELHDRRGAASSLLPPDTIDALGETMLRLWSRCPDGTRTVVVKATSTAARVSVPLMAARGTARAVYLAMAPEPWMAAILAAPPPYLDLRGHAEERIRRLIAHLGELPKPLWSMSLGELVAASWLSEALTREQLRRYAGPRLMILDFDEFLADSPAWLERVLAHFGLPAGPEAVRRLVGSPALGQYSKAPEHPYSKELRRQLVDQSRQQHGTEIGKGMAFLAAIAKQHPVVGALI